jgi:hypothetical protein
MSKRSFKDPLDDQLLRWKLPPVSAGERDRFAQQTIQAIRERTGASLDRSPRSPWPTWRWMVLGGCSAGIALLLAVIALKTPPGESSAPAQASTVAEALILWRGVKQLFPENLAAIEIQNGDTTLALSDGPLPANAPPLLIRLCLRGTCRTFLTLSGQSINAFGREFEVIEDADGGVILLSEHSAWTSAGASGDFADFDIDARLLETRQL